MSMAQCHDCDLWMDLDYESDPYSLAYEDGEIDSDKPRCSDCRVKDGPIPVAKTDCLNAAAG